MPGASNLLQAPGFFNLTCLFSILETRHFRSLCQQAPSAIDHTQQRARPAHPDILVGTQIFAMSGSWHIDKDNHLALKTFKFLNPRKADRL